MRAVKQFSENLDHFSREDSEPEEKKKYTPRPIGHLVLAWILILIVLFAFGGVCYWMVRYGKA